MSDNALICPACSAVMELKYITEGDKVAHCQYCGALIDIVDSPVGDCVQKCEEEIREDGTISRKTTIVTNSGTVNFSGDTVPGGIADMAAFIKAAGIDPSVFNGNSTVLISNSEQSGAIPPEAMSMLREMGIDLEKMGLGGVLPTPKKKKRGFFGGLFHTK